MAGCPLYRHCLVLPADCGCDHFALRLWSGSEYSAVPSRHSSTIGSVASVLIDVFRLPCLALVGPTPEVRPLDACHNTKGLVAAQLTREALEATVKAALAGSQRGRDRFRNSNFEK